MACTDRARCPTLNVARSIRIHVLIDTLGVGGAEVLLADFAAAAPLAGVELTVGYLKDVGAGHAADRLRAVGVEPRCVAIPPRLGLEAFRRVRRHLAQVRPELVHTHLGSADLLGGPAARSLGLPSVATIHSHAPPSTGRDRAKARMMTAARSASAARVIAVSESARTAYLAAGAAPERVVVVHNGIVGRAEPGAGARVRSELGLGEHDLIAAMVSSLRPEKGHDVALDTVPALLDRFPSLRLVVAGDGPLRPSLERAAAPLGDRVVLTGYRPDVMAVLDAADVLVQPSRADAFPTAILEAMAASVPVVATHVGGIGELVRDGVTGTLVAGPPAPAAFAAALAPVLEDRTLRQRLGSVGRARFEQEFTAARWVQRLREVYVEVLEERRGARNGLHGSARASVALRGTSTRNAALPHNARRRSWRASR
jgi:glycosyltransferase involved in cell wall biosynthesis